jgi:hypothetical protein
VQGPPSTMLGSVSALGVPAAPLSGSLGLPSLTPGSSSGTQRALCAATNVEVCHTHDGNVIQAAGEGRGQLSMEAVQVPNRPAVPNACLVASSVIWATSPTLHQY